MKVNANTAPLEPRWLTSEWPCSVAWSQLVQVSSSHTYKAAEYSSLYTRLDNALVWLLY